MGQAQAAIFEEGTRHHYFLEYDIAATGDTETLRACLRTALSVSSELSSASGPHRVVGFGDALWRQLAPDRVPEELRPFRPIDGVEGFRAPSTQHALWVWIHSDRHDENFASALHVHRAVTPVGSLALEEHGFTYFDSRDLIGFVDGTANPEGDARRDAALVPDGEPGAGGSFVFAQRWVHDLAAFSALPIEGQERVIGRTKPDSVELEGEAMPGDSHVSRTDLERDGVALKIYRRSAPFGTVGEHGLYFLAFACDPARVEEQLSSMFGCSGDGLHDRLLAFSTATTGAFYFAPSREDLEAALSSSNA